MSTLWDSQRQQKQKAVRKAVLDLFEHMGGSAAFLLKLDPNTPELIVAAGMRADVASMVANQQGPTE